MPDKGVVDNVAVIDRVYVLDVMVNYLSNCCKSGCKGVPTKQQQNDIKTQYNWQLAKDNGGCLKIVLGRSFSNESKAKCANLVCRSQERISLRLHLQQDLFVCS